MKNLWFLCLFLAGCSMQQKQYRPVIPMEGTWQFTIDSLDVGISEKWYTRELKSTIPLPGSMAENGKGFDVTLETEWTGDIFDSSYFTSDEYERYRQPDHIKIPFWLKPDKYYKGAAWYQREVSIPDSWSGKRVILHLERPHWETRVFVNDQPAGTQHSLATPHQYDITSLVNPGNNQISIRVDNREIIPVGKNSHSISDHTQSNWNGIVGRIYLEARHPVSLADIQVFPEIQDNRARLVVTLYNHSGTSFEGELELKASSFNTEHDHEVPTLTVPVTIPEGEKQLEIHYPLGKGVLLWSEFSPSLYRLEASITKTRGATIDQLEEEFGMREFRAEGTRFQVNGDPIFLRGTLECCIFPLTGYPPTDLSSWEYVMARCEEHGLNHLRFHSWCPPEAAFEAADRAGIYLQVECSSWANQGSTLGDGKSVDQFIYDEGDLIMQAYGNHPSFCMMAYGNEPGGANQAQYLTELLDFWKAKDNRRVYTAGAGWPILPVNEFHNGPAPRIQQWGQGLHSLINGSPPQSVFDYEEIISSYEVPFVSHEIGQWCVYPDFKEMVKYTGPLKPTNFEIFKTSLEEHHMGEQAEDFLMASGKLQALCYKAEIEAALRTPGFAGFQLLQLHDFPGQGTALVGVLDPFFNSKGYISPAEFREFCNLTVPLARMEKRVYTNRETFGAEIEMAHFGESPMENVNIICRIHNEAGEVLHEVTWQEMDIPVDNAIWVGSVEYDLREITRAEKLALQVSLENTPYSNHWDFWVYPEVIEADPGTVFITDRWDQEARNRLSNGGSVLLLTAGQVNETHGAQVEIGFSSIFWNTAWTRGQAPHTLGILCDPDHPFFEQYPTEYHSNWQWWDPVTHSQAMILDHLPGELKPLIQPIHTWFENKRLALAFEVSVENGKLMVCSIDLVKDMDQRPVSRQLLHSMLQYMNSNGFQPATEVAPEQVAQIIE